MLPKIKVKDPFPIRKKIDYDIFSMAKDQILEIQQEKLISPQTKVKRLRSIPHYKRNLSVSNSGQKLNLSSEAVSDFVKKSIKNKGAVQSHEQKLKDQRLKHDLSESEGEEMDYVDKRDIKVFEEKAIQKYYKHYKSLDRIKQQNLMAGINNSAFTALLDNSERLNVLPLRIGLVKENGLESEVKIDSFKIGDKYAQILSQGLGCTKDLMIRNFKLRDNRMTQIGASALLTKISRQAKVLDLSLNKIAKIDDTLIKSIAVKECSLEYLNLESNRLGDRSVISLLEALLSNQSLRYLNISQNMLSNDIAEPLSNALVVCTSLSELYLKWNRILPSGGQLIFQSVTQNTTLRVLDISFNLLGAGNGTVNTVCECLRRNKTLLHVDLSENNFTVDECMRVAAALRKNRTMYGFHFGGNYGYIDSKGFLVIEGDDKLIKRPYPVSNAFRIQGLKSQTIRKIDKYDIQPLADCCWICEGWSEIELEYFSEGDLSVHFSHEGYQPRLMNPGLGQLHWYNTMVPPGYTSFYYSSGSQILLDKKADSEQFDNKNSHFSKSMRRNFVKRSAKQLFDQQFQTLVKVKPRFKEYKKKTEAVKWTYQKSIWYHEWKTTDEDFDKKCFERDWQMSKIHKLIKKEEDKEKVKQMLGLQYVKIRNIYKYFSAISPIAEVWAVSSSAFVQFCNTFKLIDKNLQLKFVDLTFITTNSSTALEWKGNSRNPERGLVRYQFMESLVRLADQKYIKTGIHDNFSDSVAAFLESLVHAGQKYDPQIWRAGKYFVEQNDLLIKKYRPVLECVYKRNSRLKVKPGEKPFMSIEEFRGVCSECQFQNMQDKDFNIALNQSIMLQLDELESDRIFKIVFIEFVQAFARVCEQSNVGVYADPNYPHELTTYFRFQHGIYLLHKLCDEATRALCPLPEESIFLLKKQQVDSD